MLAGKKKKRKSASSQAAAAAPEAAGTPGADDKAGPAPAGTLIGRYTVQSILGQGGMGQVYLAHDPVIGRHVAIKVITARLETEEEAQQYRARFLREAQAAGALIHPNIVAVHDIGLDPESGQPYIVMEHVEGQDLKKVIKARAPLSQEEAIRVTLQIASALNFAHTRGIIHRDVKPANVLISERGQVKITDFGVARLPGSDLTQSDQMVGSPGFMSPEQLRGGAVDGRADLFALGVILYQLLTGRSPFEGESVSEVLYKISSQPVDPPSELHADVSADLDAILEKALSKEPADRYQTGREMIEALLDVAGDQPDATPASTLSLNSAAEAGEEEPAAPAEIDVTPAPVWRARRISPWLNPSNQWRLAFLAGALVATFVGMNWAIHELFRGPFGRMAGIEAETIAPAGSGGRGTLGFVGAPLPLPSGGPAAESHAAGGGRRANGGLLKTTLDEGRRAIEEASSPVGGPDAEPTRPIAPVCAMTYAGPLEIARVLAAARLAKSRTTSPAEARAASLRLEFSHKLASGRIVVKVDGRTVLSKPFDGSKGKRGGSVSHLLSIPSGRHGLEVLVFGEKGQIEARSKIAGVLGKRDTAVLRAEERASGRKPLTLEWDKAD